MWVPVNTQTVAIHELQEHGTDGDVPVTQHLCHSGCEHEKKLRCTFLWHFACPCQCCNVAVAFCWLSGHVAAARSHSPLNLNGHLQVDDILDCLGKRLKAGTLRLQVGKHLRIHARVLHGCRSHGLHRGTQPTKPLLHLHHFCCHTVQRLPRKGGHFLSQLAQALTIPLDHA